MVTGPELARIIDMHRVQARIYSDPRLTVHVGMTPRLAMRDVIATAVWVTGWEKPARNRWGRIAELLGIDGRRMWYVIADDAPRWEPDLRERTLCEVPTPRKPACGARATWSFRITDPADGTWRIAGVCNRHRDQGDALLAEERALQSSGTVPVPVPNRGGLFPCYLRGNWAGLYERACGPNWTVPPAGLCADTWPFTAPPRPPDQLAEIHLPGSAAPPAARPRLAVISGDGLIDDASQLPPPPKLTLTRS